MKHAFIRGACAAVLSAAMLSGCERASLTSSTVEFALVSGSLSTRTSYGSLSTDPAGKSTMAIAWSEGDLVRIGGAGLVVEGGSANFQDYAVSSGITTDASGSRATVTPAGGGAPLAWDSSPVSGRIYGVYPSPLQISSSLEEGDRAFIDSDGSSFSAGIVKGIIPVNQTMAVTDATALVTAVPATMDYAYMVSAGNYEAGSAAVLPFRAAFTAFEFNIYPGEFSSLDITSVKISTPSGTMGGPFNCNLGGSAPAIGPAGSYDTRSVTAIFPSTSVRISRSGPVAKGLKLTLFAIGCSHSGVTIEIDAKQFERPRSLTFRNQYGANITFEGGKMYRIFDLSFPAKMGVTGEDIFWSGNINVTESMTWEEPGGVNVIEHMNWE